MFRAWLRCVSRVSSVGWGKRGSFWVWAKSVRMHDVCLVLQRKRVCYGRVKT